MGTIIDFIEGIRHECRKVVIKDTEKVFKIIKKGNFETEKFYDLLMEIRDNERDDALLGFISDKIIKEGKNGKCKRM